MPEALTDELEEKRKEKVCYCYCCCGYERCGSVGYVGGSVFGELSRERRIERRVSLCALKCHVGVFSRGHEPRCLDLFGAVCADAYRFNIDLV